MQIQEGDIIRTLREFKEYIGHVHTGGVPGRNEIDDTQELNYPAIMRALVEMGYTGWVAHEFVPKGDPVASLAFATCSGAPRRLRRVPPHASRPPRCRQRW
jgi:hydroxypyruvate isomerase